jgi:phage terminase large subunit GpA-like protein
MVGEPDVRHASLLSSAQIGKSTTSFILIGWAVCEKPGPAFWVMADAEMAKETVHERLMPFLESIPAMQSRIPRLVEDRKNTLVKFPAMKLYVRGANSKAKLQSTPVMWLFLDEVRNYRKGALELVLKRTRAFPQSKTIYISTADGMGDSVHRPWLDGTRSLLYWPCPLCGHWQPWRFGQVESGIYGKARKLGGFKWNENEHTRPGGRWDLSKVVQELWYECEACGGRIVETQKDKLNATARRGDLNPSPLPGQISVHTWVAYTRWVKWRDIVIEFLKATEALKMGFDDPMKAFVRETLGEPWILHGQKAEASEVRRRIEHYPRFDARAAEKLVTFLTVDVQKEAQIFKYVLRQWLPEGESRMLDYGTMESFDQVRAYQLEHKVKDRRTWIDTGHRTTHVYAACLRFGWIATKGDAADGFDHFDDKTKQRTRLPFKVRSIDPFLGTNKAGRTTIPLVRFSSASYKDRLYLIFVKGLGPRWEIHDVEDDYVDELSSDEMIIRNGKREWIEKGTNDFGDCEILQLLCADIHGLTRTQLGKVVLTTPGAPVMGAANGDQTQILRPSDPDAPRDAD